MPSDASAGGDPLRPRASIGVPPDADQPTAVPVQRDAGPVSRAWLGDDDLNRWLPFGSLPTTEWATTGL